MPELSDVEIARMARTRVAFKMHAIVYGAVNVFLALIWTLTSSGEPASFDGDSGAYYWPIWPHMGWGLGLAVHGFFAMGPGQGMQAREEAALRKQFGKGGKK